MSKHDSSFDLSVSFENLCSEALFSFQTVITLSMKLCLTTDLPFRWHWTRCFHFLNVFMPLTENEIQGLQNWGNRFKDDQDRHQETEEVEHC